MDTVGSFYLLYILWLAMLHGLRCATQAPHLKDILNNILFILNLMKNEFEKFILLSNIKQPLDRTV